MCDTEKAEAVITSIAQGNWRSYTISLIKVFYVAGSP